MILFRLTVTVIKGGSGPNLLEDRFWAMSWGHGENIFENSMIQ